MLLLFNVGHYIWFPLWPKPPTGSYAHCKVQHSSSASLEWGRKGGRPTDRPSYVIRQTNYYPKSFRLNKLCNSIEQARGAEVCGL